MRRRARILLALWAAAAGAAAGPVEDARERVRTGTVGEAKAAIEDLVAADTADAAKALQQGVETVIARLKREQDDLEKKTKELVKFQDTVIEVSSKVVELISAGKRGTPEFKALQKRQEQVGEKNRKLHEDQVAAKARVAGSEEILMAALPGFGRFRSEGAVATIERIAAAKSGRLSRACTWALVRIGAARSRPVLADVSRAVDAGQRAAAARGLEVAEGGPSPELAQCLADKAWPVRYSAYDAAARGPAAVAIPLLIDARERAKEDEPRIDLLLGRLTGVAPEGAPSWKEWWTGNGDAVRAGTFRGAGGPAPAPPEDPVLAAVRSSRRLALVVAADGYFERDYNDRTAMPDFYGPTRDELKRALAAVADGSTFGVVVAGYVPPQAKAPARASDASRRAAAEWLGKLETPPLAPAARVLASLLVTEADDLAYADTVLFVSASTRPAGKEVADLLVAKIGEMHGPLVHCVGVGDSYDAYLLACVALQTGGSFTAGETRLHAKVPAPGSDRWTAGSVRVAAYRALAGREGERDALTALASIGEEAYPLLPMLADCLGTDRSDDVRAEALAVLAAMGPLARELLPRIEKLAGDGSGVVADAARAALDKVSLR